jgi:glycosyltransferase involved in cell wall biosynthesis
MADGLLEDLTVVIPAYRCAKYLPATVRSALECPSAMVLIAEDAGGDQTLATALRLRDENPNRIRVMENPRNLGMTGNWNSAFSQVKTPWALKLDGDDLIAPQYVQKAMEFLRTHTEAGVIAGKFTKIGPQDGLEQSPELTEPPADLEKICGAAALEFIFRWTPPPCSASMIFQMQAWRKAGGFDQKLNWCSDREIWFRIARNHPIGWYPGTAAYYRVLETSVTSNYRDADRFCFELSYMFAQAGKIWRDPEFKMKFRGKYFHNAGSCIKSILRRAKRREFSGIPDRLREAVKNIDRIFM